MDITSPFKIDFIKIKTNGFFLKRKLIKKELKKFPEKRFPNFLVTEKNVTLILLL